MVGGKRASACFDDPPFPFVKRLSALGLKRNRSPSNAELQRKFDLHTLAFVKLEAGG
jgi:hypothetical protein